MLTCQQQTRLAAVDCLVDHGHLTRLLYSTDASIYQIEPSAVAFPRTVQQAAAVIQAAAELNLPVTPRGAGSGLTGGAVGDGLIVDFARFNRHITQLDLEARTVRVGAGVVLDQLNEFLRPHGYRFGPDVATSSRATLGGMIANNSSGSHVPMYGVTADHVTALECVMADGRVVEIGTAADSLKDKREMVETLATNHANEILTRMPPGILKRWTAYGLDRVQRHLGHPLVQVLAGSEGTLAGVWSAQLRIVPLPRAKGIGILFFDSVTEAMQATVDLLDLKPAAIEHVDHVLFDQTRGQLAFKAARDLLELDKKPCAAFLIVEFFEDVAERLAILEQRRIGKRRLILTAPGPMALVWNLRKSGLNLVTSCAGNAKPTTCIEDTAVRPAQLPEYVAALQGILKRLGLTASFYGHAATGLLHVRPVLDLHRAEDVTKLRQVADEVAALVRQFKGSLAAEHGVGIARTAYLPEQVGEPLLAAMRQIKDTFDPRHLFNPGKVIADGRYRMDTFLRPLAAHPDALPFAPRLAFARRDGSFIANLEQCNGCGGCTKQTPVMCPTFIATGDELMSTRGRANVIRAWLEGRTDGLNSPELDAALSNCLACKACATECPSNVNLPLLKAELAQARHAQHGTPLAAAVFSHVDWLGQIASREPTLANAALGSKLLQPLMHRLLGLAPQRPLPPYAAERFDWWFARRPIPRLGARGKVILWDDTFARYHDPHIARAAVTVLEAAGHEVLLLKDRACCGRPAFSQGDLKRARELGRHNLALLAAIPAGIPVLFLEPSCWSMFAEDYRELKLPGADAVAPRCLLFEQFLDALLQQTPDALTFTPATAPRPIAIHAHCHAKALTQPAYMQRLAQRIPGSQVTLLDSGCCGMAGAFGMMADKYELSVNVAEPLLNLVNKLSPETILVASGTSCRHQLEHLAGRKALHLAELLAQAL
ncbi:MAG: FAD-linked oxidase C-terminal domain-containing protein [Verrucomicrobiota bacterium]